MPKTETVVNDDDNAYDHTFFLDIPVDTTIVLEQDVIDNNEKPVHGLDHVVDSYINMEVRLPSGEKELYGQVVCLCLDKNGRMIRNPDNNPYMDTVLYEIKFEDGTSAAYGANIIAENMQRMCNNEGFYEDSLHSIVDIRFRKNAAKDGLIYSCKSKHVLRKTTRGVDLLCAIKSGQNEDGSDRIRNS